MVAKHLTWHLTWFLFAFPWWLMTLSIFSCAYASVCLLRRDMCSGPSRALFSCTLYDNVGPKKWKVRKGARVYSVSSKTPVTDSGQLLLYLSLLHLGKTFLCLPVSSTRLIPQHRGHPLFPPVAGLGSLAACCAHYLEKSVLCHLAPSTLRDAPRSCRARLGRTRFHLLPG